MITRHSEKWDIIDLAADNNLGYYIIGENIYIELSRHNTVQIRTLAQLKGLIND